MNYARTFFLGGGGAKLAGTFLGYVYLLQCLARTILTEMHDVKLLRSFLWVSPKK